MCAALYHGLKAYYEVLAAAALQATGAVPKTWVMTVITVTIGIVSQCVDAAQRWRFQQKQRVAGRPLWLAPVMLERRHYVLLVYGLSRIVNGGCAYTVYRLRAPAWCYEMLPCDRLFVDDLRCARCVPLRQSRVARVFYRGVEGQQNSLFSHRFVGSRDQELAQLTNGLRFLYFRRRKSMLLRRQDRF